MRNGFNALALLLLAMLAWACHGQKHAAGNSGQDSAEDKALKKKYAAMLGVDEKEISNIRLYKFIDEWYGVPYKYGGKTKSGVDCSGFAAALYQEVYKKTIAGSASSICSASESVSEKNLEEGDLVFFKINSDKVSHVGVYLRNRHFVHASTHKGVIISSLDETYYKKYFFRGGKVK